MKKTFDDLVKGWTEAHREAAIERASIREYEGLQGRDKAEQEAIADVRAKVDSDKAVQK